MGLDGELWSCFFVCVSIGFVRYVAIITAYTGMVLLV